MIVGAGYKKGGGFLFLADMWAKEVLDKREADSKKTKKKN